MGSERGSMIMTDDREDLAGGEPFGVVLFDSTSAVLAAERLLKKAGVPFKIIPVPRHLSSDCGVCLRFSLFDRERLEKLLDGRLDHYRLVEL